MRTLRRVLQDQGVILVAVLGAGRAQFEEQVAEVVVAPWFAASTEQCWSISGPVGPGSQTIADLPS